MLMIFTNSFYLPHPVDYSTQFTVHWLYTQTPIYISSFFTVHGTLSNDPSVCFVYTSCPFTVKVV